MLSRISIQQGTTGKMTNNVNLAKLAKELRDAGDVSELVESMKQFGWNEEFPAIADEDDVVLVGNRRMKAAKQAKVAPVIKTIKFGTGEKADVERVKLALISNLGHKPMTTEDRKRIAEHLYGAKQWTMQRIADALNVTKMTISRDLECCNTVLQPARPKGGRPKGSKKPRKVRPKQTDNQQDKIISFADAGMTSPEIAIELGIEGRAVRHAIERERIRREAEAQIDPATLKLGDREKLEKAIAQYKRKLEVEFNDRVSAEARNYVEGLWLPEHEKMVCDAREVMESRVRGPLPKGMFKIILSCLHSDSRKSVSDQRLNQAFNAFAKLETILTSEEETPTRKLRFPKTWAEAMELKRQVREQRKTARANRSGMPMRS